MPRAHLLRPLALLTSVAALGTLLSACSSSSAAASATPDAGKTTDTDAGKTVTHDGGATKSDAKTTTTKDSGAVDAGPCAPSASCKAAEKSCLGLVDNAGKTTFGLRMDQLTFTKPAAFATGPVASILGGDVTPDVPTCNEVGSGTFSWLLQFDTTAGTIETGGAKPPAAASSSYSFAKGTVAGVMVSPATYTTGFSGGAFSTPAGTELDLPVYLDATGDDAFVLPVQSLALEGTVSSDQGCIGTYNAATLDPSNSCQPAMGDLAFANGGSGTGFITLTKADSVIIASLNESLCVLLSGDPGMTADGSSAQVCTRDGSGAITFKGDWCAASDSAATGSCADAVQVSFGYAASSVAIE